MCHLLIDHLFKKKLQHSVLKWRNISRIKCERSFLNWMELKMSTFEMDGGLILAWQPQIQNWGGIWNDFVFISRNWDTICINLQVVGAEQEMIEHFIFSLCLLVFLKTFEFKLSFYQSASYIPFSCLNFEIAKNPSGIAYINFKFSIILYVALLQLIISSSF